MDGYTITPLEYGLMDIIAFHEFNQSNGAVPESNAEVGPWFWPDEIASSLGITEQGVGGVASSLVKKGLAYFHPNSAPAGEPSDATMGFTDKGFEAWKTLYGQVGRSTLDSTSDRSIEATDEEAAAILELTKPVAAPTSAASGFQYLTRDALQALAAADPAARQAYRIERRKAARAARKARKS